jgi:hypothetical protein
MGFTERAVAACERAMQKGIADEGLVHDVLKRKRVDVQRLEIFLTSPDAMVRQKAAEIISKRGRAELVLEAALKEEDKNVLLDMLKHLGKEVQGIEALDKLLRDKDSFVKEAAISMFRRVGKVDVLFPLIFDTDNSLVERIKRYLQNEQG